MNNVNQKILMMPDYRADNPYQLLLAQKMRSPSINIIFSPDYRRVLPLFRTAKDHSATVLHLHWLTPYLKGETLLTRLIYSLKLIIDLWLIHLTGIRIIWTVHNHLSHNSQFPRWELWLRKRLSRIVDEIIVHNYSTAQQIQVWNIDFKITVIPHGHYRDIYPAAISQIAARTKLNLPVDGYLYLNLGMIRPYKGIENLLQVWQSNQAVLNTHTLMIAGQPSDAAYEANITELTTKTEQTIFQPGFVPSSQMHLYFSAADLVVLPFTNILTSGSLILAMSYHKPIIAPRQGGIAETLMDADDLLYDSQDNQGLVKSLKASAEADLNNLSNKVKMACDRLNWDQIAHQTAQLYRN